MKEILFKPSLYINETDYDLFAVYVNTNFWAGNLKEQYTYAFQDKIVNSLKVNRIDQSTKKGLLEDNWQIDTMQSIQIIDNADKRLAEFITETDFCYNLISDFVKRLEILKTGKTLESYYEEKGYEYAGLTEIPYEIANIDFLDFSSLIVEY